VTRGSRLVIPIALLAVIPVTADPRLGSHPDPLLPPGAIRRFVEAPFWHPGGVFGSALSPDGTRLATAAGGSVILWDTATSGAVRRFDTPALRTRMSLAFSPDGRWLVAGGGYSGDLFVWDVRTGTEVHRSSASWGSPRTAGNSFSTDSARPSLWTLGPGRRSGPPTAPAGCTPRSARHWSARRGAA